NAPPIRPSNTSNCPDVRRNNRMPALRLGAMPPVLSMATTSSATRCAWSLIAEQDDAVAEGPGLSKLQVDCGVGRLKQRFAPSKDHRVNVAPLLIDQVQ